MRIAEISLKGVSRLSWSRYVEPKQKNETHDQYEKRIWRERFHFKDNRVVIPSMALKRSLIAAAKFLKLKIPGARGSTYTQRFTAGIQPLSELFTNIEKDSLLSETILVSSTGEKNSGGGKRVAKIFPYTSEWSAHGQMAILDSELTEDVVIEHLSAAGQFVGIGRWRPENAGLYGQFIIEDYKEDCVEPKIIIS